MHAGGKLSSSFSYKFQNAFYHILRALHSNCCMSDETLIVNELSFVARAGARLDRQLSSVVSLMRKTYKSKKKTKLGERRGFVRTVEPM